MNRTLIARIGLALIALVAASILLLLAGCARRTVAVPAMKGDPARLRGGLRDAGDSVTETAKASGTIEQEAEALIRFLQQ